MKFHSHLSAGLGRCTSLVHLNLRSNAIEDEGAKSFAGVLGQCVSLTHVDLWKIQIKAEGAGRLAKVLVKCTSLAHLCLGNNKIGTTKHPPLELQSKVTQLQSKMFKCHPIATQWCFLVIRTSDLELKKRNKDFSKTRKQKKEQRWKKEQRNEP